MKYWKDNEIEYMTCEEGQRITPYKHPASKVTKILSTGEKSFIEVEIIPNTSEIRNYIDAKTYEYGYCLCVMVERRKWQNNGRYFEETFWIPLSDLGYEKEPYNSKAFDEAMKII